VADHRAAPSAGIVGRGGEVTAIQSCGSALDPNVHLHTLVAEGVFAPAADGTVCFVPAARPPTDLEVGRLLAAVRRRIVRLVRRRLAQLCRYGLRPPVAQIAPCAARAPVPGAAARRLRPPPPRRLGGLLRRTFALAVLACPACGGRLRLVATIAEGATGARRGTVVAESPTATPSNDGRSRRRPARGAYRSASRPRSAI